MSHASVRLRETVSPSEDVSTPSIRNQYDWRPKRVQFRYSISYVCLFRVSFDGQAYRSSPDPAEPHFRDVEELSEHLPRNGTFAAFIDLRIAEPLARIQLVPGGVRYSLNQTPNYFADLSGTFEDYLKSLSPKTRSTLKRKVKKFAELAQGEIDVRMYTEPNQMAEYHRLARQVAERTYQEKLFQGALPESEEFCREMEALAAEGRVRAFLLFLEQRPVAYLYLPVEDRIAEYSYLGYDPECAEHSPGTVLLYKAIEALFQDGTLKYLNFGYGENQTKKIFATGQYLRADVYHFRKTPRTLAALYGHTAMDEFSEFCGRMVDRMGLKQKIRSWLRSA